MELEKGKVTKLVIVLLVTLAALAVMSVLIQIIQTVLPFLIVGAGIYAGYRWALSEAPAPTADEVEEQARGIFSRFRRTKQAVEATVKVGEALSEMGGESESQAEPAPEKKHRRRRPLGTSPEDTEAEPQPEATELSDTEVEATQREQVDEIKRSVASNPQGGIEFKDRDVVISATDIEPPDTTRLEEKAREKPQVTQDVLAQIEERRRRMQSRG